jgi:transposase
MSKQVAPYPPGFRAEAIRLVRSSGKPQAQIARELGLTTETLRIWRKQAEVDAGQRSDGLTTDEQEEVRRLRRENRILREERATLKKAAAQLPRRRPARSGECLRVRGARAGRVSSGSTLPRPGCLPQRLLDLAQAVAVTASGRQYAVDAADCRHSLEQSWHVRRAAGARRAAGGGKARWA